jgi:transketolase
MSAGSLGVGVSAAVGLALGARLRDSDARVYTLLGDGECQEGSVWEAAFVAARYELGNLTAIVDVNGLQQYGWPGKPPRERAEPVELSALAARWSAFGWSVLEVDGHDFGQLQAAFSRAQETASRPSVVLARTVKGRGVPFMEGQWEWHGKTPTSEEARLALSLLGEEATK